MRTRFVVVLFIAAVAMVLAHRAIATIDDATSPRLLRKGGNGEFKAVEGVERDSILKEFLFESDATPRSSEIQSMIKRENDGDDDDEEATTYLFSQKPLRCTVSHNFIVIIKDWVDWKRPGIQGRNPKDTGERDWLFQTVAKGIGGLLFEPINGPNSRHEAINDIHNHAGREQKGPNTEHGHEADQLHQNDIEDAVFRGTKKVIKAQQRQGKDTTGPCVNEE
eukprot:scaffold11783_cov120-Cylindrotheca_fusiformis.AAC.2